MNRRWLIALFPALVVFFFALLIRWNQQWNFRLVIDLIAIFTTIGFTLVFLAAGLVFLQKRYERRTADLKGQLEQQKKDYFIRLLRAINHELQNPLHIILAQAENLANPPDSTSPQIFIQHIERQAQELVKLLNGVRKLTRLQMEGLEQDLVDMETLLRDVVTAVKRRPETQQRHLQFNISSPLPIISGDADLLMLAVGNLLDNALKYTETEDRITVHAYEEQGWIIIKVLDQGRGIPKTEVDQVQEEERRGSNVGDTMGSGLGLMFVSAIIERHGGEMIIHSVEEVGTRVTLKLPIVRLEESE